METTKHEWAWCKIYEKLAKFMLKNYDSVLEAIPWIRPFIDVKTMNIHQKMVIKIEKTMKAYFKAVILSL